MNKDDIFRRQAMLDKIWDLLLLQQIPEILSFSPLVQKCLCKVDVAGCFEFRRRDHKGGDLQGITCFISRRNQREQEQ
jgi:hypothetical protein